MTKWKQTSWLALFLLGAGCSGGSSNHTFSPEKLLVVRSFAGDSDIVTLTTTGQVMTQLTNDVFIDTAPRFSPDGKKIAFTRIDPRIAAPIDAHAVWIMDSDGKNVQEFYPGLLLIGDAAYDPNWLPNGSVLFRRGFSPSNIVSRSITGGDFTNLTPTGVNLDSTPSASPDGKQIAFIRRTKDTNTLFLMNADGSNIRSVISDVENSAVAWSRDSTRFAFVHLQDGNPEIYLANTDGTNQKRLTDNPAADFSVNWSRDNTKLVFASDRDGNNEIYTMNPDGTAQTRITNNTVSDVPYGWL